MSRQTVHWYAFGPFRIAPSERVLRNNGDIIPVAPKVFEMLLALVESRGRVVQKEELLERIWPGVFVEEANLNVNMSVLRRVLGDKSRKHQYIETIPKRGYRFVAPVQELDEPCAEPTNEPATGHLPEGRNDPFGSRQEGERSRIMERRGTDRRLSASTQRFQSLASLRFLNGFGRINTTTVAGTLCLLTLAAFVLHRQISKKAQASIPGTAVKFIAVLPFKPLDPGTRDESLELGIADTLIIRLSNLRLLIVRPTSAVRKFNALDQDPVAAGRALGADVVLDGSFQRVDDKIRVTLRVVRVADGVSLWAGQFDEQFTNIFSLEDAITTKVANLLVLKLSAEEARLITKRPAADNEAYRLYLLGRFYWSKKTEEGLQKGLDYFQQAIARDPTYALAQAGLSDCYNSLAALSLSPPAMTFHYAGRYDEAIAQQRKTIELDPNFPWAHAYLATSSARKGMYTEAIAEAQKALRLSGGSPRILAGLGRVYAQAGLTKKAEGVLEQLHELEKRQYVTPFHTALIYEALGRNDEAFSWLDKAYAERSASLIYARVLPFRDRFRSDSRLADLLARMNLGSEVE